jgi:hypothetical protein
MTPDEIAKALQAFPCVFENKDGELSGIGYLRVEEMDDSTVTLVFVSDEAAVETEVKIMEDANGD